MKVYLVIWTELESEVVAAFDSISKAETYLKNNDLDIDYGEDGYIPPRNLYIQELEVN